MPRYLPEHLETWRQHGGVLIPDFFTAAEVAAVRAEFENVFERSEGATQGIVKHDDGSTGNFHPSQFKTFAAIPFSNSPALNLIGLHPVLIEFAKRALDCDHLHLYQCQAWAKFTGDADYSQPFHCDFVNHTLTVPSEDSLKNSITILCYFTDVTEGHGPMHYVSRVDSAKIAGPEATLETDAQAQAVLQKQLMQHEQSSAAPAGSIFPYGIDVYHRGTNMTEPGGVRFAVMACFKRAGDDAVGYHAWPFHQHQPWAELFAVASAEQLACLGVPLPGHSFWTETTLARAQLRYPTWNLSPYQNAMHSGA